MPDKITHKVLDLHYTEEEGQECYTGSLEECEFWVSFQSPEFMYQIVPLPKQQVEVYNKENQKQLYMITNANDSIHNSKQGVQDGLTKREYFAAMAMQGFLAAPEVRDPTPRGISDASLRYADALIEALNKEK